MAKYFSFSLKSKDLLIYFRYISVIFVISFGIISIIATGGGGDGGSSSDGGSDGTTYNISGYIQKGPFISGSAVTIYELDSNLIQTGKSFQTQTVDDFGSFSIQGELDSNYIEIISTGFYFNEVQGNLSSANITLSTISYVAEGFDIYVNILTSLASNRIRYLVQNENKSFEEALSQAQSEVLTIFNITETGIWDFDQMDISEEGNSNAILLAVSAILQGSNTVAELSELISKISLDIKEDGTLDNSTYRDEIINNSNTLDLVTIRDNLQNRYASLGISISVSDFETYVYSDSDSDNDPFSFGQSFNTGIFTQSVIAGDLDRDGNLDLAVARDDMGSVSVHLNNGDGTFALSAIYNTGPDYKHTNDVAIGDLDDDGAPDLIAINFNTVSVLINNGDGTFATAVEYAVEADWVIMVGCLDSLAIGDLEGDGDLDLAVTSYMPHNIFIFLNKGDGTFSNEVSYSAHNQPHDVVSGDLDGDGDLDLAVTESDFMLGPSESSVSVFLNNGDGTFAEEVDYSAGEYPFSIALGDLDGDGALDLIAADNNSEDDLYEVSVLLNSGEGTFTTTATYSAGNTHRSMVIGDLDGDGDLDMAVTNFGGLAFFWNNGDGTFATALDPHFSEGPSLNYSDATLGDFDGDSDLDIAVVNSEETVSILLNNTITD